MKKLILLAIGGAALYQVAKYKKVNADSLTKLIPQLKGLMGK